MSETAISATKHIEYKGVDPRNIVVMEGFNVREDFGDLTELKESIIEYGVKVALIARKVKGEDKWELIDGERRWRATMLAIEEGHPIKFVPVKPFSGNQEDSLIEMFTTGMEQKQYDKLEQAEIVKRFVAYGYSVEEIAKKLKKSIPTIYELNILSRATKKSKAYVKEGKISGRTVTQIMKTSHNERAAEERVEEAVQNANKDVEVGSKPKKVTTKNVAGLKPKTTDERLEELIAHLKEVGIENERVELLRSLAMNIKTLSVEQLALFFS